MLWLFSYLECQTLQSKACVFPFSYQGVTYNTCTDTGSDNGAAWCATEVRIVEDSVEHDNDELRLMLMGKWWKTPGKIVKMAALEQVWMSIIFDTVWHFMVYRFWMQWRILVQCRWGVHKWNICPILAWKAHEWATHSNLGWCSFWDKPEGCSYMSTWPSTTGNEGMQVCGWSGHQGIRW
jgi:hypothetical protein